MIPILPPELIYTILESTTFSHHDLTRVALPCRALLPLVRKLLSRSIEVYYRRQVGYMMHVPGRKLPLTIAGYGNQPYSGKNCATALEIFGSNPLLPNLVKKLQINNGTPVWENQNTTFLGHVIFSCENLEVLICSNWKWDPRQLATIVGEVKRVRVRTGQKRMLGIHLEEDTNSLRRQTEPLELPLSSFAVGNLDHRFGSNYLANSTSSLRALDVKLSDAHLYRDFPNVTTLFIRHAYSNPPEDNQNLLTTSLQFKRLDTLCCRSNRCRPTVGVLLWLLLRLPPSLRFFSLEYSFAPNHVTQLANELVINTPLKQLNVSYPLLQTEYVVSADAEGICRRKGVKLTIGEEWNLWDNFCTSSFHAYCTRSILTCSRLK